MIWLQGKNITSFHFFFLKTKFPFRNVLLDENFEAVVSDFGMSRVLIDTSNYGKTKSETGPLKW